MTSESTRFLGHPRETKPTLGLVDTGASRTAVSSVVVGGVTEFYSSNFVRFSRVRKGGRRAQIGQAEQMKTAHSFALPADPEIVFSTSVKLSGHVTFS